MQACAMSMFHAPPSMQAFAEVDACKDELLRTAAAGEQHAQHGAAGAAGAAAAAVGVAGGAAVAAAGGPAGMPTGGGSELGGEQEEQPGFSLFETARESLGGFGGDAEASPAAAATGGGSKARSGQQPADQDRSPDTAARQGCAVLCCAELCRDAGSGDLCAPLGTTAFP